jgi:hypothetical protein
MKCHQVQQHLLDYTEHVLDTTTQSRMQQHLQTCQTCTQELHDIEETLHLLSSVPVQEPSESFWKDFTAGVMRKVCAAEPPASKRIWFPSFPMRVVIAVGAILILCVGIYAYVRINRPSKVIMSQHVEESSPARVPEIVSDDLPQDMVTQRFALFDEMVSPTLEIVAADVRLDALISGLTTEEKQALLSELQSMHQYTQ